MAKRRAEFHCLECDQGWFVPPDINCPRCGPGKPTEPDPAIWEVGWIPQPTEVYPMSAIGISAHLLSLERISHLTNDMGVSAILDVANDPGQRIVWRPESEEYNFVKHGVRHVPIWGLKDKRNGGLDESRLDLSVDWLARLLGQGHRVMVHCAAGLRRAPHVVYAYLRTQGHDPVEAWDMVERARPLAFPDKDFMDGIETWMASRC